MANISQHKIHNLNKWNILNKVLHRSKPCMVVLSGLEAFCRHHRSISHKIENVTQVNKKQDISTDISNAFTLSSSWVLRATGFCNKCVLQQYGFMGSFSSKGLFQTARGLFGLICLLACSSSWRAARKDFTLSVMKKREWVLICLCPTQILKLFFFFFVHLLCIFFFFSLTFWNKAKGSYRNKSILPGGVTEIFLSN